MGDVGRLAVRKLSRTAAIDWGIAALENAEALLEDAVILVEHERAARAFALLVLSIEEAGKGLTLLGAVYAKVDDRILREWAVAITRQGGSHVRKILPIVHELIRKQEHPNELLRQCVS